jgi:hypothetical protein
LAQEIRRRAAATADKNIYEIARALGYRVVTTDDLGGPAGILIGKTIAVLASLGPKEQALTIAHELAHAVNDECHIVKSRSNIRLERILDRVATLTLGC